ncbi:amino acid permease [Bailinhaonella thermotolerans]|uniref:Amino acid permease n=1 Tax=Bailinhaonella thermotolerans TaxID=1070861 RepID=A0A3A4B4I0_9ACTN|nr:amino acid permease [Bailinhaonella thermotolerans]
MRKQPPTDLTNLRTGFRHRLRQVYVRSDLVVLGLGVMIGGGIFNLAGRLAHNTAGPGVILSFMIAGIICLLAALCYAELASTMPSSGSAYSFTYVIFGELWAWIIGWALILELQLAAAVVARLWSMNMTRALEDFGVVIPPSLGRFVGQGEGFDLFTLFILLALTAIVAQGARLGVKALWVLVIGKLVAIGAVIVVGATRFDVDNLTPMPTPVQEAAAGVHTSVSPWSMIIGGETVFGWGGIFAAAGVIAFAYIGFDLIATASEEAEDAPRNVPQGMIRSLVLVILIYIAVAVVMVGMSPHEKLNKDTPLVSAFDSLNLGFMTKVIDIGAMLGLTTVILVLLVSQTRVVFSMARDGLLPRGLAELSSHYRTPSMATLAIGGTAIVISQAVPVLPLEQLVVMGTLFAFLFVAAGVVVMRVRMPHLPRGFRVPLNPVLPILSALLTLWLMLNLDWKTWMIFGIWMVVGVAIYLVYGRRHSMLAPQSYSRRRGGRHAR